MFKRSTNRPLRTIQQDIQDAVLLLEQTEDESTAKQAYTNLKLAIEELFHRTNGIRRCYYDQKNTIERQANDITELMLENIIGEAAHNYQKPGPAILYPNPDF